MIIAYVSSSNQGCYEQLKSEFTDVKNFATIEEYINFYAASKNRDVVLVYRVGTLADIAVLADIYFRSNIYMIVLGKNDVEFSLLAGKIGVDVYLNEEDIDSNIIKKMIIDSQKIIKKRRGNSNVSVFTGISGGVGTTTISMNLAKSIADDYPDKNVLYLDFASTKAISNIFFGLVQPKKTIIDITMIQNMDLHELFESGLERRNNNFYFVPGIQKHTDKEALEKRENIQRYLSFIHYMKEKFDFIIIDVGVFKDVDFEIDIQEIADSIYVVTEFSIPSMSILKTYIDIIDKSGWYNKTHILANRADSYGTVTQEEARKILSKGLKHNFEIHHSLPNDALHLRECWNDATLVCEVYPEGRFMKEIREIVKKYFLKDELSHGKTPTKISFFEKVKRWL